MKKNSLFVLIRSAVLISLTMFILCGLIYPLALTGISQVIFPKQANGSIIKADGREVGSELIGQAYTDPRFMRGRPSKVNYNVYTKEEAKSGKYKGVSTGSDNYAASNPDFEARVTGDFVEFIKANMDERNIPHVLLTASDPLLDPYILPQDAKKQIPALMESTGFSQKELEKIIDDNTTDKINGIETAMIFKVYGWNGKLSEKETRDALNELKTSKEKIITVSKVNLAILKKINKININIGDIPADLLTASGSGLDPDISPASAKIQVPRLMKTTGLSEKELNTIITNNTTGKFLGVFGEKTVNVLKVNLALDGLI